jgi:hypothetical protein
MLGPQTLELGDELGRRPGPGGLELREKLGGGPALRGVEPGDELGRRLRLQGLELRDPVGDVLGPLLRGGLGPRQDLGDVGVRHRDRLDLALGAPGVPVARGREGEVHETERSEQDDPHQGEDGNRRAAGRRRLGARGAREPVVVPGLHGNLLRHS